MAHVVSARRRVLPLVALLAAACTDSVVAPVVGPPGSGVPGTPVTLEQVVCTGDVSELKVTCGRPSTGGSADILYGGQNLYVKLTSSNVAYNGGTGQFTFTTTLQSLIEQPIGTTDGVTLDPSGVKVFFGSGPTVTAGTGSAAVVPDGFGAFTAAGQAYYQYNQVLTNGQTSAGKTWTFILPNTVTTFSFIVFISSPVQHPNGYITLDGMLPGSSHGSLHPGSTHGLTAVMKSPVGRVMAGSVTFGTTNAGCATVDGSGMVTGVQAATCSITATSGLYVGALSFNVSGSGRTWNGSVSADWAVGANWNGGLVPVATDSAIIPAGVPNFPALSSSVSIGGVDVADPATLSLGGFDLTASANVATGATVGSGILSSGGRLILAGFGGTVRGRLPSTLVTGTYSLSGDVNAVATQQVDSGELSSDSYALNADSQ
jgi:hypothetical protein